MKNRTCQSLFPALPVAISWVLAGCGSGPSVGPSQLPPTPAPPVVRSVISQGSFTNLSPNSGVNFLLTTTATGVLDATVDWTFAASQIDIYVLKAGTCSVTQYNARQCQFIVSSETPTPKPRVITTASLAPGAYELLIINFGTNVEAVSYQAGLTTGGASAAGVGKPVAAESRLLRGLVHP
jgi:hypothetical protein